ncbi:response regulator [Hoeflea prorocentri]|uniref:Response regulator transcription factor n=1 Tax=Hoeflea prorocentri TaxID=1922333 RepID=A0A9X3UI74_9HYPH|nr:response regulator transcription factor [Hoeflea prorocentri]MCY6381797.1 response regulator transcription factor [Hoeflea prorocentri]MDA5399597.1 response regulator transcription factor [Hoeflea prorocentri]
MTTKSPQFTALIADDHDLIRSALRLALEKPGSIEPDGIGVVAEASNGIEAVSAAKRFKPDLIILDISMPLASGAEVFEDIRRWSPDSRIVILTAVTSPGLLASIKDGGAAGLFSKAGSNEELFAQLPHILRGGTYFAESMTRIISRSEKHINLTARERQYLTMVLRGKSNADIADGMGISAKTAEKHRASMMKKLGVHSAAQLFHRANELGMIEASDQPD